MKEFFAPLTTFVMGMVFLLAMMVVWPAMDTPLTTLASGTASWHGWGWDWIMTTGVVKWIAFIIGFLTVCFLTGIVFLRSRPRF